MARLRPLSRANMAARMLAKRTGPIPPPPPLEEARPRVPGPAQPPPNPSSKRSQRKPIDLSTLPPVQAPPNIFDNSSILNKTSPKSDQAKTPQRKFSKPSSAPSTTRRPSEGRGNERHIPLALANKYADGQAILCYMLPTTPFRSLGPRIFPVLGATDLGAADAHFRAGKLTYKKPNFATIPTGGVQLPELCLLGRSNVGKSTVLNTMSMRAIAPVSANPGRTRTLNGYAFGPHHKDVRMRLLDLPGYGHASSKNTGYEIVKFLMKRKMLCGGVLFINAGHGVKFHDKGMLEVLRDVDVPYFVLLSKSDQVVGGVHGEVMAKVVREVWGTVVEMRAEHLCRGIFGMGVEPKKRPMGALGVKWALVRMAGLVGEDLPWGRDVRESIRLASNNPNFGVGQEGGEGHEEPVEIEEEDVVVDEPSSEWEAIEAASKNEIRGRTAQERRQHTRHKGVHPKDVSVAAMAMRKKNKPKDRRLR